MLIYQRRRVGHPRHERRRVPRAVRVVQGVDGLEALLFAVIVILLDPGHESGVRHRLSAGARPPARPDGADSRRRDRADSR